MAQVGLEAQGNNMTRQEKTMISIQKLEKKIPEMTLRDYFAGQVLAGMGEHLYLNKDSLYSIAKTCYNVADAMIKARK